MNWLFFTRSNGDVDCRPNSSELDTLDNRRAIIGDLGAHNFEVINDSQVPKNANWVIDKYISAPDKKSLKAARDIALMNVVVNVDGNDIWANPTEEQNITGRIRHMDATGASDCKWVQGFDVYVLTKAQLETVLASGTAQCSQIYDDYIAAIEAL